MPFGLGILISTSVRRNNDATGTAAGVIKSYQYLRCMQRYFLEVGYMGNHYSGFQVQDNAATIQQQVEKAFSILQRETIVLTGSSRTDSGVHAKQNFFHFDYDNPIHPQFLYKLNAILPTDIVLKNIYRVAPDAHCRFNAVARTYQYRIYRSKDPFLQDRAFFFPFKVDTNLLHKAAAIVKDNTNFTSFSKRNTQVKNFNCSIHTSQWHITADEWVYEVSANRFLRGMVRGLTATMLLVARGKIDLQEFKNIISAADCSKANFDVPGFGLCLIKVTYPDDLLLTAL